jgi:predicted nucleotidyltransferase
MTIMLHSTFSRKGGRARSAAKTAANRAKMASYWKDVRAGRRPPPARPRVPPAPARIAALLRPYCRSNGIRSLELFGSVARDQARRGSDVDLIATFSDPVGLRFFGMPGEMAEILGVPVDLMTRQSVEQMTNPYRRNSILADARQILAL